MKNQILACTFAAIFALAARPAYAQDYGAAGNHLTTAQDAYNKGDFATAITSYQKAYDITKDPVILFNLGESYERTGQFELAIKSYRRYVAEAVTANDRADIEKRVVELEKKFAAKLKQPVTPAPVAPAPAKVSAAAAPVATTPAVKPVAEPAAPVQVSKTPTDLRKEAEAVAASAKLVFDEKIAVAAKLKGKKGKKAMAEASVAEEAWKAAQAKVDEAKTVEAAWIAELARQAEVAKRAAEAKQAVEAKRLAEVKQAEEKRALAAKQAAAAKKVADATPPFSYRSGDQGSKYRTAAWVMVATTVALVGSGVIFGLVAQDRSDEASRSMTAIGSDGQPPFFDAATQQQLRDLRSEGQAYNAACISLLTAAGLSAITSIVLFVVDSRIKPAAEKRVQIAPSFAPGQAGLAASLRF